MTIKQIQTSFDKIKDCLHHKHVHEALNLLQIQIQEHMLGLHQSALDNLKMTYENVLKFTISGTEDPERTKIYHKLLLSAHQLTDKARQSCLMQSGYYPMYSNKNKYNQTTLSHTNAQKLIDELSVDSQLSDLLKQASIHSDHSHDNNLYELFERLWQRDFFSEEDVLFVVEIMQSDLIPWHTKSLLVSAISLGLFHIFDEAKMRLLSKIYQQGEEQVAQRAFTGLILAFFIHDKQLYLYDSIPQELETLHQHEDFSNDLELVLLQLIKSKDTEKLSKKLQEEILPEVMKMAPKLSDKLDIENMLSAADEEDKNPDWQEFFKDSPTLYNKIEEFSKLQLEGSDVFMSTFAQLKRFPFFNTISNWLIPFYLQHPAIQDIFNTETKLADQQKEFLESITFAPYMCNSDKYSFCLNFQYIPEEQKGMMMDMFIAEIRQVSELSKDEEALNKSSRIRSIYTQYIQDLYRFFKLHPQKQQLQDIFTNKLHFSKTWFAQKLHVSKESERKLAEFYFQKEHYRDALIVFHQLEQTEEAELELFQKIGYCYQQLKEIEKALSYFENADLLVSGNSWNLKKIAYCHRYLNHHEQALSYYLEAEKLEKDNLFILANIGHCYLDLKDYEKALDYYFKVEYLAPNNHKVLRPIAWISFILGKYEDAQTYYDKIPDKELTRYDFINIGHLYWCLGNRQKASEYYLKSIQEKNLSLGMFEKTFMDDLQLMSKHAIDTNEFPLMLDYIKSKLQESKAK
jgi:tetratricopeptide (TPR) repeat protein